MHYLGGDRAAAVEPLGEGEHGRREEEKERGDKDEAEPPGADPARILGGDPRVHGEVHVEPRREGAQDEAHGRPQDPHPDRDGEVERWLSARHVIVDVWYAQGVDRCLAHTHPEETHEEHHQDDVRDVRLGSLLRLVVLVLALFRP